MKNKNFSFLETDKTRINKSLTYKLFFSVRYVNILMLLFLFLLFINDRMIEVDIKLQYEFIFDYFISNVEDFC